MDRRKRDGIINIIHFLANDELHCSKDAVIPVWIYLVLDRFSGRNVYDYLPTNKPNKETNQQSN